MKRSLLTVATLLLSASLVAAADKSSSSLNKHDTEFLKDAAIGALAEVDMGRTASSQGTDPAVKSFGQRMVTDHSKELDQLRALASQKGVTLPSEVDKDHRKEADKLAKLQGKDYDEAYAKYELKDHKKDLKDFRKEADKAEDSDVKNFAQSTLPTLQEHHDLAEQMVKSVKGEK